MTVSLDMLASWGQLSLDELALKIGSLSAIDREAIFRAAGDLTSGAKFIPNLGPQMAAFFSPADILFYGGAAGAGKSGLILGLALTEHQQSLIMREQFNDLSGLTEAAIKLNGSKRGFNGSNPPSLRTEDGRLIQFSGATKDQWMGQPFDLKCVGAGTPVIMGDWSECAIEKIRPGDSVMTVEGPRKVLRTYPAMVKQAVWVRSRDTSGRIVASQLQSLTHELLTDVGWVSHDNICSCCRGATCEPMGFGCRQEYSRQSALMRLRGARLLQGLALDLMRDVERLRSILRSACSQAIAAFDARLHVGICLSGFGGDTLGRRQRFLSISPQELLGSFPQSADCLDNWPPYGGNGVNDARFWSEPRCYPTNYLFDSRPDGGRARRPSGLCSGVKPGLICLLPQDDAERPIPNDSGDDALDRIPRRILHKHKYIHPYTKETRRAGLRLELCAFEFIPAGERVLFDIEVEEINSFVTAGGFVNKNCFDEAAQMSEDVIKFHLGWIRSVVVGQRKRAILASNPPVDERGQYLIGMFRPWIDSMHPRPAKDGELRWYAKDPDGIDIEVDGPEPVAFPGYARPTIPMSRTFIRARLSDNPYLADTGYDKMLDAMDEPYRSAMRDGNFMGARKDKDDQVIPMAWIRAAMERWVPYPPPGVAMTAVGMDVSQGGADPVVLAPRYGAWFAKLEQARGKECPDGPHQAAFVERHRRDGAPVVVDVTGGYGGDVCSVFKSNQTPHYRFNAAGDGIGKANDGSGRGFANRRAQAMWRFREALNPDQPGGSQVALPPDPELEAELSAPTMVPDKRDIQIESKKDIRKRLGRSTNKADAVIMAWEPGEQAFKRKRSRQEGGQPSRANVGFADVKAGWPH